MRSRVEMLMEDFTGYVTSAILREEGLKTVYEMQKDAGLGRREDTLLTVSGVPMLVICFTSPCENGLYKSFTFVLSQMCCVASRDVLRCKKRRNAFISQRDTFIN